jgi:predicted transcriptional regulator
MEVRSEASRCYSELMPALKAHVKNGRLVLDEPTDLPEGSVVPLAIAHEWDDLDDEQRAALHESLDEAEADVDAGRVVTEAEVWAAVRASESSVVERNDAS